MSELISATSTNTSASTIVFSSSSLLSLNATTASRSLTSTPTSAPRTITFTLTVSGSDVSTPEPSTFNSNSNDGAPISRITITISMPTPSSSLPAAPTESVNHPSQDFTQSQPSHLKASQIVAISVSVLLFILCAIGIAICLVRRHRRSTPIRQGRAPSQNVDADTIEKYAGASKYHYTEYQQDAADTKGTLPLFNSLFSKSRRSSRQSGEFGQYQDPDALPSPFLNEELESTHTPLAHAVSLADARPFSEILSEAQFEYVDLIPSSEQSPSPPKASAQALPPIVIPEHKALGRKATTNSKRVSRRSSRRHSYRAIIDAGDVSDVDSESMYSQASASTTYSASSPQDRRASIVRGLPLAAIPASPQSIQNKHDSNSTIKPGDVPRNSIPTFSYTSEAAVAVAAQDSSSTTLETAPDLSREDDEDAVLVAKLLKSRVRPDQPPARSESIVSHIERKGSIRPAYRSSSGDELGRQRIRPLKAIRKSHHGVVSAVARPSSPQPEMPQRSLGERENV